MNEASINLAKQLYELTGWEGVVEWFPCRPLADDNYPCYSLGYLVRRLADRGISIQLSNQWDTWLCLADDTGASAATPEDAIAQLCIHLWQ